MECLDIDAGSYFFDKTGYQNFLNNASHMTGKINIMHAVRGACFLSVWIPTQTDAA